MWLSISPSAPEGLAFGAVCDAVSGGGCHRPRYLYSSGQRAAEGRACERQGAQQWKRCKSVLATVQHCPRPIKVCLWSV